jgi:hypothetical protein
MLTYKKLLDYLKKMPAHELDRGVLACEFDSGEGMMVGMDIITTSVEIDICDPGDTYILFNKI